MMITVKYMEIACEGSAEGQRSLNKSVKKNVFEIWRLLLIWFIIGCNQYVFLSNYKDAIIINKLVHQARL